MNDLSCVCSFPGSLVFIPKAFCWIQNLSFSNVTFLIFLLAWCYVRAGSNGEWSTVIGTFFTSAQQCSGRAEAMEGTGCCILFPLFFPLRNLPSSVESLRFVIIAGWWYGHSMSGNIRAGISSFSEFMQSMLDCCYQILFSGANLRHFMYRVKKTAERGLQTSPVNKQ